MERLTRPFRGSEGTVLDIGAHHGFFSIHLLAHWPEAICHAFEPIAGNAKHIPDDPHIILHRQAVSANYGELKLVCRGNSGMWSAIADDHKPLATRTVKAISIRHILRSLCSVEILKMDVECYELKLIRAAGELLHKVKCFVLEDHTGRATPLLEALGFKVAYRAYDSQNHPILVRE